MKLLIFLIALSQFTYASYGTDNIKRMNWENLEVVWLEDDRFPTYNVMIYFADGALSESASEKGSTEAALQLLTYGTRRFSRKDIADNLDFFGVTYASNVTHEYSLFKFQGLTKDVIPTAKKFCHLFQDATYPQRELKNTIKRAVTALDSKVNDPSGIASLAFRELSLAGSPYSYPVSGKKKDMIRLTTKKLKGKLNYLNKEVKKRIYLSGPKSVLSIKDVILNECGWKGEGKYERAVSYTPIKSKGKPSIYLITVPKANQAQVRIGKFINKNELRKDSETTLASEFLGGGFTSRLMRVLRQQYGLTYSVSAFAGNQKEYGRAGIATFTKNETVDKLLIETRNTIESIEKGDFGKEDLDRSKGFLSGSFPFRFQTSESLLGEMILLDHENKTLNALDSFKDEVNLISKEKFQEIVKSLYHWNDQTIVVVGPRSLQSKLKDFGDVKVINYKKFL
ncbi:MAG: insulinase family protein [Oligoflexia bacterium]|nr:insulinase family protein [Oligoflexia bacterium]